MLFSSFQVLNIYLNSNLYFNFYNYKVNIHENIGKFITLWVIRSYDNHPDIKDVDLISSNILFIICETNLIIYELLPQKKYNLIYKVQLNDPTVLY